MSLFVQLRMAVSLVLAMTLVNAILKLLDAFHRIPLLQGSIL